MSNQPTISVETQARIDHIAWLGDYAQWRSEHRAALAMLTKLQATILEREAAIDRQAADVQAHELELQEFDLIGCEQFTPEPGKALADHESFRQRHDREREVYERTKRQHVNLVHDLKKLDLSCQATTQ